MTDETEPTSSNEDSVSPAIDPDPTATFLIDPALIDPARTQPIAVVPPPVPSGTVYAPLPRSGPAPATPPPPAPPAPPVPQPSAQAESPSAEFGALQAQLDATSRRLDEQAATHKRRVRVLLATGAVAIGVAVIGTAWAGSWNDSRDSNTLSADIENDRSTTSTPRTTESPTTRAPSTTSPRTTAPTTVPTTTTTVEVAPIDPVDQALWEQWLEDSGLPEAWDDVRAWGEALGGDASRWFDENFGSR